MGKILVHEFITLDGVMEDPAWTRDYAFDPKMGQAIGEIMSSCQGLLLGRKTYEMFAATWAGRTAEDDPGAPFMNESPKYVISRTAKDAGWNNSRIVGQYDPERIRELKAETPGNLYVSGSGTLVQALLADRLADELHLFTYPLAMGSGRRLFAETGITRSFKLAREAAYDNGVVYLAYHTVE